MKKLSQGLLFAVCQHFAYQRALIKQVILPLNNKRMKVEKFKVLLYLKKSGLDKFGKAPIMGRITVNNTMAD